MPPLRRFLAVVVVALVVGCGGAAPTIPAGVADDLASLADAAAAALESGDGCAALDHLETLRSGTTAARDAGDVPPPVAAEILTTVDELAAQTQCDPPAEQDDGDDDEDEHEDEEKRGPPEDRGDRGRGEGRGGDDGDDD